MLQEEQKEERDYQRRPHICGLFFSFYFQEIFLEFPDFNLLKRDYNMNFSESLKKNKDFQYVYKNGKSNANKYLVMYVIDNNTEKNRIGISVSKKVGNSIVRHRLTRLIRESYRLNEDVFQRGKDIVVIARAGAKGRSFFEIESALLHLSRLHKMVSSHD